MSKFTFICEEKYTLRKTTVEFEGEWLSDILPQVEQFLKGAGFNFTGTLELIDEELDAYTDTESEYFDISNYGAAQPVDFSFSDDQYEINLDSALTSSTDSITIEKK